MDRMQAPSAAAWRPEKLSDEPGSGHPFSPSTSSGRTALCRTRSLRQTPRFCGSAALVLALAASGCGVRVLFIGGASAGPLDLDPSFGQGGLLLVDLGGVNNLDFSRQALDVQPDGMAVICGRGGTPADSDHAVLRVREDGTLDPAFGVQGIAQVDLGTTDELCESIRVQPDGKLSLGGFGKISNTAVSQVARLLPSGAKDLSFAGAGFRQIDLLAGEELINDQVALGDGSLRLCGQGWPQLGNPSDWVVYSVGSDGSLQTSFGVGGERTFDIAGSDEFGGCAPAGGGAVLLRGLSYIPGRRFDAALARMSADGALDGSFGDGSTSKPGMVALDYRNQSEACGDVAVQPDGKIVCAGRTSPNDSSGPYDAIVWRLLPDGRRDASFNGGQPVVLSLPGDDAFQSVLVLPDGRLLCGGYGTFDGRRDLLLAVLGSDGTPDAGVAPQGLKTWHVGAGLSDAIVSLRLDRQGRLLVLAASSNGHDDDFALMRLGL